jgi:ATP-dependent DNA helicase RecG
MALHINLEDLLSARTVESDRIEFKEGWNPDAIYRSIGAFANDFDNSGGGYILIGVVENLETKTAVRPVKGLTTNEIGELQKDMIGYNNLVKPYYAPKLFIENVDGQQIIVLWVLAGNERPYEVPETITSKHKNWKYFVRKYASSIEARGTDKEELIALTNNIPFDDRANNQAAINDLSMVLVHDHLRKIGSKLAADVGKLSNTEVLQQLALLSGPEERLFPRNIALMLFTEKPHIFFPYTYVEIVYFPKGADYKEFIEKKIEGPVQKQITDTLAWLKTNILEEKVIKVPMQAEAIRTWNYPYAALEEAVANSLFHRNYQEREPVKIRIEPHAILLYNSGGPDRSIKREDFTSGRVIPKRYRNRRLGDFLKELRLTEGHATGLPALQRAIRLNGSPDALFDFDDERTWFQVTLPIHFGFQQRPPFDIDLTTVKFTFESLDNLLNQILDYFDIDKQGGIESDQAGAIAGNRIEKTKIIDNQIFDIFNTLSRDIISAIVGAIVEMNIEDKMKAIQSAKHPANREDLLGILGVSNHRKNYDRYLLPLVEKNWLTMTIPDKPTSPKQQYVTTLKGRLILELLKYKSKQK